MNGKLRAPGLALLATFALGAIGAQGAMAEEEFHTEGEVPTYVTGHQENGESEEEEEALLNKFIFDDGSGQFIECHKATFEGQLEPAEITVHPSYSECGLNGWKNANAALLTTGCYYVFTGKLVKTTEGVSHAPTAIECEAGGQIGFAIGSSCEVPFEPFNQNEESLTHGITFNNESKETYITASVTVHGIDWKTSTPFFCTLVGFKKHSGTDGTFFNQITFEGFVDAKHTEPTPISWTK